jgi:predicted acylesterase/phospholipase RssA
MPSFNIGINMAGAISAGAYTAGVLDFLIEALDQWEAAKQRGDAVPKHDVSLEVLSGASAGGMCAAITAAQIQQNFDHVRDPNANNTNNRLYESWVNRVDIRHMLLTGDLKKGEPVQSLLDSTIIGEIAQYALTPGPVQPRRYVSSSLTLFLTLTNLRGVPYSLNTDASGSLEESTAYYGDRLRFQIVKPGDPPPPPAAKPLPISGSQGAWPLLQQAAIATGAFPIFLQPRILTRDVSDYTPPMWETLDSTPSVPSAAPTWPLQNGQTLETLNVDGGVIDNDPFDLSHDYLLSQNPGQDRNPREALNANSAVVTVAPFPAQNQFDPQFQPSKQTGVMQVIGRLLSALISQSRFFGESLALITTGNVFSRFLIAPSDLTLPTGTPALQCSVLGAFGGFFERSYRAHDFLLGRRNCQKFLLDQFILPQENPIIKQGLDAGGEVLKNFGKAPPNATAVPQDQRWIPLIPLCGTAAPEVPHPARGSMSDKDLDDVVDLIVQRFKAVIPLLIDLPSIEVHAIAFFVALHDKGELRKYLRSQLP